MIEARPGGWFNAFVSRLTMHGMVTLSHGHNTIPWAQGHSPHTGAGLP